MIYKAGYFLLYLTKSGKNIEEIRFWMSKVPQRELRYTDFYNLCVPRGGGLQTLINDIVLVVYCEHKLDCMASFTCSETSNVFKGYFHFYP